MLKNMQNGTQEKISLFQLKDHLKKLSS